MINVLRSNLIRSRGLPLMIILIIIRSNLFAQSDTVNTVIIDWGDNTSEQLFPPFYNLNIKSIATGYEHSLAIHEDIVIGWGANNYDQLNIPDGKVNPIKVVVGLGHSVVLQQNKLVKAWGLNDFGQTEVSTFNDIVDIAAGDEHTLLLHENGTVSVVGNITTDHYDLTPPAGLNNVVAIAAGNFHNLALKSDGTVVAWGTNEFGQSNVPVSLSDVRAISGGLFHSLAIKNDNTVVGWGDNSLFAQVTIPTALDNAFIIDAGSFHSIGVQNQQEFIGWGSNRFAETFVPFILYGRDILDLSAGFAHNTVIAKNHAPTEIKPDTILVFETTPSGTELALIEISDPDPLEIFRAFLVEGEGSDDNAAFNIEPNDSVKLFADDMMWKPENIPYYNLKNTVGFDYDLKRKYTIRAEALDMGSLSVQENIIICILDENIAPEAIYLSNDTIDELQPIGTFIGEFTTQDPDSLDYHTYSFVDDDSTENQFFYLEENLLYANTVFHYYEQDTFRIKIKSTDSGIADRIGADTIPLSLEQEFYIIVKPINFAPTDILLSNNKIQANTNSGSKVGDLSTHDEDPEDSHVYNLVNGDGDKDNEAFSIVSNMLFTNQDFGIDKTGEYSIRIRSTDNGIPESAYFEKVFTIYVSDQGFSPNIDDQIFSVREDAPNGTAVGTILNSGINEATFRIINDPLNFPFSLDSITGAIKVTNSQQLNYNIDSVYQFLVEAVDTFQLKDSANITIKLIEVRTNPLVEDQLFEISEEIEQLEIGEFIASSRNPLQFEILDGNIDQTFTINDSTGIISIVESKQLNLDFYSYPLYTLRIKVTDKIHPEYFKEAIAFIKILNSNFEPDSILLDNNSIEEQLPIQTKIGSFSINDRDILDVHTYEFSNGLGDNDNSSFSILGDILYAEEIFSFNRKQKYTIAVKAIDNGEPQKWKEQVFEILITPTKTPSIPTAITPNGDGDNDYWEINSLVTYPKSSVKIFDKNGMLIFSSIGYNNPWDGTHKGKPLPIDAYYYIVSLNNESGTRFVGTVSIIR